MTRSPCHSAALAPLWAAKTAEFFAIIVETILTIAETVGDDAEGEEPDKGRERRTCPT